MKSPSLVLCLLTALNLAGFAQASPDDVLKREAAERLQQQYGLTLAPAAFSLAALNEIESRLAVCFRLKAKLRQFYDYRTTSLAFLQDLEHRWDACERIQRDYNILLRHDYYTAPALADLEKRLAVASRIYQTYGRDVNWRDSSLQHLETTEKQLAAVQAPLAKPHTQPLAHSAVVFRSSGPTPTPEPPPAAENSTAYTASYAYQPTPSYSPSYPTLLSTPMPPRQPGRRVTSAPVIYYSGYSSYYVPNYPVSNYCVPSVPRVPAVPSVPCVPSLIRLW